MMEAVSTSETSIITEDFKLHTRRRENLKSQTVTSWSQHSVSFFASADYTYVWSSISIIASSVGQLVDPCTTTILWTIARPHLLYSSNSPVPLSSTALSQRFSIIHAWFHKLFTNQRNVNSAEVFVIFPLYISCGQRSRVRFPGTP
jgi:hypothetical protein